MSELLRKISDTDSREVKKKLVSRENNVPKNLSYVSMLYLNKLKWLKHKIHFSSGTHSRVRKLSKFLTTFWFFLRPIKCHHDSCKHILLETEKKYFVVWQTNKIRCIFVLYYALFNSPPKYLNGLAIKHCVSDSVNICVKINLSRLPARINSIFTQ